MEPKRDSLNELENLIIQKRAMEGMLKAYEACKESKDMDAAYYTEQIVREKTLILEIRAEIKDLCGTISKNK